MRGAALPETSGFPPQLGIYIVPVTGRGRSYGPGDAAKLMMDYDYPRANEMLVQFVRNDLMSPQDLTPTGIYIAGFDVAFPEKPNAHAIFEISGLRTASDVRDWLIAQQQAIEIGNVTSTAGVTRVSPTFSSILEGLGETVVTFAHITSPAQAGTTIPCS